MPAAVNRTEPTFVSDERSSLVAWLDYHRATLLQKCEGLSGAQLAQASVPPSNLTLLGLLQHMLLVEWWWFEHIFADGPQPEPINAGDDAEYEFTHLVPDKFEAERETRDLRWILVHMIEEYARHNGHADLLREAIDGATGD
jgi:hypothetical protein